MVKNESAIDASKQPSILSCFVGVPKFDNAFGEKEYRRHVTASNSNLLPRDLTITLKIPNFEGVQSFAQKSDQYSQDISRHISAYVDRLLKEIALHGNLFEKDRRVTQINFDGNFSNLLVEPQGAEVLDEIAAQFHLDVPSKLTLCHEIIQSQNSANLVSELIGLGFNKFSFCTKQLLQRKGQTEQSRASSRFIETIQTAQNGDSAIDINLCLNSKRSSEGFAESILAKLLELGVGQINVMDAANVSNEGSKLVIREALKSAGYIQMGLDQFCLPNTELGEAYRNGNVYCDLAGKLTTRDTDYVGIGLGATSQLNTAYAKNQSECMEYSESINQNLLPIEKGISLTPDHRIRAAMVKAVLCNSSIDLENSIGRYIDLPTKTTLREYFSQELKALIDLAKEDLLRTTKAGFEITPKGLDHKLRIAAIFDPGMRTERSKEPVHIFKIADK